MDEVSSSLFIWTLYSHLFGITFFLLLILYNYYILTKKISFVKIAKLLQKNTPFFHALNFLLFYTGIVMIVLIKLITFEMILMIFVTLYLMISEIRRWKKQRVIKSKEIQKQEEFKLFAKKHYLIQSVIIILTYITAKVI